MEIIENINAKEEYLIEKIYDRKNQLKRPSIANIDNLVLVVSEAPRPDLFMIDKLIVYAYKRDIECIVCINKSDIIDKDFIEEIKAQYEPVVKKVLVMSAETGDGVNALRKELKGSLSAFAGQSGVGKSTLLNSLSPEIGAEIGGLNRKSKRGNNTTRHTEIFDIDKGSFIADTPGFMVFDLDGIEPQKLHTFYPEFEEYREDCKYRACYHHNITEKDCAVKRALKAGKISERRYNRYVELYKQIGGK